MGITGDKKFQAKLTLVANAADVTKLWGRIGFQAIDIINQRTLKGKDVRGAPFSKYSAKYEARKKARGGKFFGGVNLHDKGHMFASLKAKPTHKNVTLFFSKTQEAKKAAIHNAGEGDMPKREFFELSPMERKSLSKLVAKELRKVANG